MKFGFTLTGSAIRDKFFRRIKNEPIRNDTPHSVYSFKDTGYFAPFLPSYFYTLPENVTIPVGTPKNGVSFRGAIL